MFGAKFLRFFSALFQFRVSLGIARLDKVSLVRLGYVKIEMLNL